MVSGLLDLPNKPDPLLSGFLDKPDRVKSAEFTEYYELNDLKDDFIGRQIERFIIVCLADGKIVDRQK